MDGEIEVVLRSGLLELGLKPTEEAVAGLLAHLDLVSEWNQRFNLTALKDYREMVLKHLVDSAAVVSSLGSGVKGRMLDVGSGAGYPGVVVKCLVPAIHLVLLESLGKRCRFLEEVGLTVLPILGPNSNGYDVVWGRAEEVGQQPGYRESFDLVTARAVADLRILAEYCLPFCRIGGQFVALKGPAIEDEVGRAEGAIQVLGGRVDRVIRFALPDGAGERCIVIIKKVKMTPKIYPRRPGVPTKHPL